jgi:chromate transporter
MGIVSARAALRSIPGALVMVTTFVTVGVLQWPVLPVLALIVPLGIAAAWPRKTADA